jgi:hypothetical protein
MMRAIARYNHGFEPRELDTIRPIAWGADFHSASAIRYLELKLLVRRFFEAFR